MLTHFSPYEPWKDDLTHTYLATCYESTTLEGTNATESAGASASGGDNSLTGPEEVVAHEYPVLPNIVRALGRNDYPERVEPRGAKLVYFPRQTPPPSPVISDGISPTTYQEWLQREREIIYDRGTNLDESAREARRMNAIDERRHSFDDYLPHK